MSGDIRSQKQEQSCFQFWQILSFLLRKSGRTKGEKRFKTRIVRHLFFCNVFSFRNARQRWVFSFIMEIRSSRNPLSDQQNTITVIACEIQRRKSQKPSGKYVLTQNGASLGVRRQFRLCAIISHNQAVVCSFYLNYSFTPFLCLHPVAGHLSDCDWESADCSHYPRLSVPHCEYFLVGVVLPQPLSQMAAAGPSLPDMLRHVRLHGHSVYR